MKNFSLVCLLICLSVKLQAQTDPSPCNSTFYADLIKCDESVPNQSKFATLKWDFSDASLAGANIKIEIVPILDCWEGTNAAQFREKRTIDIGSSNLKGETQLRLMEMYAKCLKWRTVVQKPDGCTHESEWKFHTFIAKRS